MSPIQAQYCSPGHIAITTRTRQHLEALTSRDPANPACARCAGSTSSPVLAPPKAFASQLPRWGEGESSFFPRDPLLLRSRRLTLVHLSLIDKTSPCPAVRTQPSITMDCTDATCVNFLHGLQLPVNASAPGNYTLPDGSVVDFGVTPAYLNQSRDGSAIAALVVIFVISTLVAGTRLFVRATSKAPGFGWDDGILVLAMALYTAYLGMAIHTINLGEGRHILWIVLQGMIDVTVVSKQEIMDFALHLVYNTALVACRLSALAFFHRLSGSSKIVRNMVVIGYVVMTLFYLPQMFTLIFHCHPVTALWPYDFQVESSSYTCLSWGLVYLVNGCLSVASDLMLFAVPAVLIRSIKTDKATKFKLALILYPGIL